MAAKPPEFTFSVQVRFTSDQERALRQYCAEANQSLSGAVRDMTGAVLMRLYPEQFEVVTLEERLGWMDVPGAVEPRRTLPRLKS